MLRWILQEHDSLSLFKFYTTDEIALHAQIGHCGVDQTFWFAVTDSALRQFFSKINFRFEILQVEQLEAFKKNIQRSALPSELVQQVRKVIADEGMNASKFSIKLMIKPKVENPSLSSLNNYCEMSAKGTEGVLQAIKGCWASILERKFMNKIWEADLNLSDLQLSLFISALVEVKEAGEIYSVSPSNLLDHRNLYATKKTTDMSVANSEVFQAYTIERDSFAVTNCDRSSISKTSNRELDLQNIDLIKKISKIFLNVEKNIVSPLKADWIEDVHGKIYIQNWTYFKSAPSSSYFQSHLNTQARHFWLKLSNFDSQEFCQPYWFSFIVRNFRPILIEELGQLKLKKHFTTEYDKVIRHFFGILKGRLYLNLGALHRLASLLPFDYISSELELNMNQWQRRSDKEMRVYWEDLWPEIKKQSMSEIKKTRKIFSSYKKTLLKKRNDFDSQFEKEIQNLYDFKWDMKNISEVLIEMKKIENRICKFAAPIIFTEIEYWSYKSYIHSKNSLSGELSFFENDEKVNLKEEGSYFNRLKIRKKQEKWQKIKEDRAKNIQQVDKLFQLISRKVNFIGSKFVSLGILQKPSDIFNLTQEELISFEEGRLTSVNLQQLANQRSQEYQFYKQDKKTPEVWFTVGLVGLAQKYPNLIPIDKAAKNLIQRVNPFLSTSSTSELPTTVALDLENSDEDFVMSNNVESVFISTDNNINSLAKDTATKISKSTTALSEIQDIENELGASNTELTKIDLTNNMDSNLMTENFIENEEFKM